MIRLFGGAFVAFGLMCSAQAMPLAPAQSENSITLVREACGAGILPSCSSTCVGCLPYRVTKPLTFAYPRCY